MTKQLLASLALVIFATGCTLPTPLSRSYDDPYNAPLPNETTPPSLSEREEDCIRTNNCRAVCVSDEDCEGEKICYKSQCIDPPPEIK